MNSSNSKATNPELTPLNPGARTSGGRNYVSGAGIGEARAGNTTEPTDS